MGRRSMATAMSSALCAALMATGCVGAASRTEFEDMVRERGGGVSATAVSDVLDDLRTRSGADDPDVRMLRFNFDATTAVLEVRNPARPDDLDRYTYRNDQHVSTEPVRLSADDDLDELTVALSTYPLADIERIADEALAAFDSDGGYVTAITVGSFGPPPVIRVDVESPRSSGTATFDPDGRLTEFDDD